VVGRVAANILGGAAAVTAVGGTGQFDPLALGQAAFMSLVGRFAPGARKPGADGDAVGAAVKDAPGGPSSAKPPREILGDASAAEMGHPGAGLRGAEALIRVAEHSGHLPEPAAGTTLESYANQIGVPITAELGRLGAAVPKVVARDLGNPDRYAMMDFASNTITLNTGAMDGQRPLFDMTTAQGRQNILSNVFHEARHAEQLFHALRHRATLPNAGEPLPGIHPAIEAAAERAGPPRPRSAEAEMGRRAYDEYFGDRAGAYREGQDQAVRDRIREDIRRHESDRNRIMIQARGQLRHPKNKAQLEEFQRLKREIDALETELNRLDNVYWNLYVEVDARGAQADLLREVDTARRIALEQRFKDATDGLDRLRGNAEAGDQAALTNLVAAMRNYQREMEKMRLSLPKPPAPATTGGGGDGGGSK